MSNCCVVETKFTILFPSYLEAHIKSFWEEVTEILKKHGLKGTLDLIEGSMVVKTTMKTTDPIIILYARDFLKLLARSVPISEAEKVFADDVASDILNIGQMVTNTLRFVKRRERLVGPHGQTLRTLEILSGCYIHVQGKTVSIVGPESGVKKARTIVRDCMRNIHPVYGLKRLMILKELEANPSMADKDWSKYLPQYTKTHGSKTKTKKRPAPKKEGNTQSMPMSKASRKEDKSMETGEAFLAKKR